MSSRTPILWLNRDFIHEVNRFVKSNNMGRIFSDRNVSTIFNKEVNVVLLYALQVTFPTKPCPQRAPCPGSRALSVMPTIPASGTQPLGNLQESSGTSMTPCKLMPPDEDFKMIRQF